MNAWARQRERVTDNTVDLHTVGTAITLGIASALVTELAGAHALFGAFVAGAIVPRTSGLANAVADRLEGAVGTALLPVFFAYTGVRTDIGLVTSAGLWLVFAAILVAAIAGKLAASAAAARLTGMSSADAWLIVILSVGLDIGVIGPALFAMMVLMALTTTAMTSPLVSAVLKRAAVEPVARAGSPGNLRI